MDWIFDHLQLVIAVAGAVAYWINQQRKAARGEEAPTPGEKSFEDPELAARTRRIREEIQRKIAQRNRGYEPPPAAPRPEPEEPPLYREVVTVAPPALSRAAEADAEMQRTAAILAQQASLMEQLRQVEAQRAATMRRTQFETEVGSKEELAKVAVRGALGDDLRDPAALRRAFILREILGPPVALRP